MSNQRFTASQRRNDVFVASALSAGSAFGLPTGISLMRSGHQKQSFRRFGIGTVITVLSSLGLTATAGLLYMVQEDTE